MSKYLVRRIVQMVPTLWMILTMIFALNYLMPGDPLRAALGEEYRRLPPEVVADIEEELGLNKPFLVQYGEFMGRMIHFDLGKSYIQRRTVNEIISYRVPVTLRLTLGGLFVSLLIGVPAGIISALKQYSWIDHTLMIFALLGLSMPVFWQGLVAQLLLTQSKTGVAWFPPAGYNGGDLYYMILPSLVLGTSYSATVARITRSSMLEVRGKDYLQTARAKGLKDRTILVHHHLRNALIPVITIIGLQVSGMLGGALLTETIFNWPGLGRATVEAIVKQDTPVVMGIMTYGAVIILVVNLITDLAYAMVDPRIRYD
ncbi:MAG: ABC transporter permease [Anaerolineae bacterium]|nr:ABC transporter permease [Anaerolineae bacterium]